MSKKGIVSTLKKSYTISVYLLALCITPQLYKKQFIIIYNWLIQNSTTFFILKITFDSKLSFVKNVIHLLTNVLQSATM